MSSAAHEVEIIGPDGVPIGIVRTPPPRPARIWLHILLLVLTFLTTTLVVGLSYGASGEVGTFGDLGRSLLAGPVWMEGLAFSLPLLAILLSHEMGHYLACRHYRLDATLPFFIPAPVGIGTFGAFIRIRSPLANKRELFDVGAAGPLAGFAVALPVLFLGVALSHPVQQLPASNLLVFGEPLLFKLAVALVHPHLGTNGDLLLNPTGYAAWFGLLVTALNLLPFGQLDGGHITYAMFGRWQRRLAWPALFVLVVLSFRWIGWLVWVAIALIMRVRHPWMPDEDAPLDPRRRLVGWLCIVIFILCFTPQPITVVP